MHPNERCGLECGVRGVSQCARYGYLCIGFLSAQPGSADAGDGGTRAWISL